MGQLNHFDKKCVQNLFIILFLTCIVNSQLNIPGHLFRQQRPRPRGPRPNPTGKLHPLSLMEAPQHVWKNFDPSSGKFTSGDEGSQYSNGRGGQRGKFEGNTGHNERPPKYNPQAINDDYVELNQPPPPPPKFAKRPPPPHPRNNFVPGYRPVTFSTTKSSILDNPDYYDPNPYEQSVTPRPRHKGKGKNRENFNEFNNFYQQDFTKFRTTLIESDKNKLSYWVDEGPMDESVGQSESQLGSQNYENGPQKVKGDLDMDNVKLTEDVRMEMDHPGLRPLIEINLGGLMSGFNDVCSNWFPSFVGKSFCKTSKG